MNFEQIKQWYIERDLIFYASFEITQNCNFDCKHCYCPDKKTKILTFEDAKKIIDKLYDIGCFLLILTGGEILTCEYFKELYLWAPGVTISLNRIFSPAHIPYLSKAQLLIMFN